MDIHKRHTGGNRRRYPSTKAKDIYIIQAQPQRKEEVEHSMRQCWPLRSELTMTDSSAMKGKRIIKPFLLQM